MTKGNNKVLMLAPMSSVHERFNIANIEALSELGCEIHIAANFSSNSHDKEYEKRLRNEGVFVHNIPFVRSSLLKNLATVPVIKGLLKSQNFDLVHCHTETGGILTRLAMIRNGHTKYVYTPHGMSFYKGSSLKSQLVYRPIEKWICAGMDANLAMNMEEFDVLKSWNKNTARFIHGIGVSLESIQKLDVNASAKKLELGIPQNATVIFSVGELNDNKNHKVVLEALSLLENKENLYYLICGEGENKEMLLQQAQQLGLADRVVLPGYRYDIAEIYHIGDIFVFPSFHEGLSVALMQAMIAGLPIICSEIRGNVDLIDNGINGFLTSPQDSKAIGNALQKLLSDSALRAKMGNLNMQIIQKYSLQEVKKETFEIYHSLLIQ